MVGRVYLNLYEVTSPLGQGSMGQVFLARHRTNGRPVVLKVMHAHIAAQQKFRDLFQREVECMTRFKHPYAVALLDASLKDPNGPCLVLEYVRGVDFDRLLQHYRRFSLTRIGRLIGQLCEVLQAAHGQGIIHRDLKPANLMVADWGKPLERMKVMDFGLAKLTDDGDKPAVKKVPTGAPIISGTPEYMCPEQIRGQPLDQRGDLYSVGVILFELLTGRLPFVQRTVREMLDAHVNDTAPAFARLGVTGIAPALEAVVHACLAKDPARRPANALELGQRLEAALGQKILDHGGTPTVVPPPPARTGPATLSPNHRPTVLYGFRPTQLGVKPTPRSASAAPKPPAESEDDELVFQLDLHLPSGQALERAGGFVTAKGGKVVQRGADSLRALLGNSQTAMTELELQIGPQLTMTLRPVGTPSYAAKSSWRARCEQIQADLRAHLLR